MEDATRDIRELMLRISRQVQQAEVVEARLAADEVDVETYVGEMRAVLEQIQDATLRISEELNELQEGHGGEVR